MKKLLTAAIAALALSVVVAPTAEARWWPTTSPFKKFSFSRSCVPQKALSFQLRVVARRVFGEKVCIRKARYRVDGVEKIPAGYKLGQYWCLVSNSKPGTPFGTLLSIASATRFCGKEGRGWAYVDWR